VAEAAGLEVAVYFHMEIDGLASSANWLLFLFLFFSWERTKRRSGGGAWRRDHLIFRREWGTFPFWSSMFNEIQCSTKILSTVAPYVFGCSVL
jgi:hypothetical protein